MNISATKILKHLFRESLMSAEFIVSNVDMEYGSIYSRLNIVKIVASQSIQRVSTTLCVDVFHKKLEHNQILLWKFAPKNRYPGRNTLINNTN